MGQEPHQLPIDPRNLPKWAEVDKLIVEREGLKGFVRVAWHLVEPGPFKDNWHIGFICEHLEAVSRRQIDRLLINVPPGCMKSRLVGLFWPLWHWIGDPTHKWLYGSYSEDLAKVQAKASIKILDSDWWRARWGNTVGFPKNHSPKATTYYENDRNGVRITTSCPDGTPTGKHANTIVGDDLHKPMELTTAPLKKVEDWVQGVVSSRQADPETTARVFMGQRLAQNDIFGIYLEAMKDGRGSKYEHICLPMEFNPRRVCKTSIGKDPRTEKDELLWKNRYSRKAVDDLKGEMKTRRNIAAQLQQDPAPEEGNRIKRTDIRHWGPCNGENCKDRNCPGPIRLPALKDMRIEQSWDFTFKGKEKSDYTVGDVWGYPKPRHPYHGYGFLLDQVRGQWTFPQAKESLIKLSKKWPQAFVKKIEDKANGPAIVDSLKAAINPEERLAGLELVNPKGGKEIRVEACEPLFEAHRVVLPSPTIPWVEDCIDEYTGFPSWRYDDRIDTATQSLMQLVSEDPAADLRAAMAKMG